MKMIVYEDENVTDLYPLTLTRPAFQIPIGAWTLQELLTVSFPEAEIEYRIRTELTPFFDFPARNNATPKPDELWINARAVPSADNMEKISAGNTELDLIGYQHEAIVWHKRVCDANLQRLLGLKKWREIQPGVYVGENVKINEHVIFHADTGVIIIDDESEIFPYTVIEGPVKIGKGCKILEHTLIRDRVVVGNVCKIRGEVTESVLMDYSNKQHYGFLGNAFVGTWVNMGAGTCNSDLKNTYGKISVKKGNGKINTGEQFLGCVIGDYSKSAINTSIFTGKTIGVSSYLYGFIDEDVPSFVSFMKYLCCGSFTFNVEKAIETQQRMFLRRNHRQEARDVELLKFVFQITQDERDIFFSNKYLHKI